MVFRKYKGKKNNLLKKFMFKEWFGEIRGCRSQPIEQLFQQLPSRLAFNLSAIAPISAITAGHIFLGFTKCGQFVLSYTYSSEADDHTLQISRRYRLHWWLFTPYSRLRKVAEVTLFGDQILQESFYENVLISICQWPRDLSKILVYGCSLDNGSGVDNVSVSRRVYLTVTAVPSLENCSACYQVAKSYEDEDLAEQWNSCVRFSCLQHGVTVHASFDMVPTYPKFIPKIQLKLDGYIVLNAGNFIHVLSVDLENVAKKSQDATLSSKPERTGTEYGKDLEHSQIVFSPSTCESLIDNSDSVEESEHTVSELEINSESVYSEEKDRKWQILIGNVSSNSKGNVPKHLEANCDNRNLFDSLRASCSGDSSLPRSCARSSLLESLSKFDGADKSEYKVMFSSNASSSCESEESFVLHSVNSNERIADWQKRDQKYFPYCKLNETNSAHSTFINTELCCPSLDIAEKEYEFIDEITESRHEKLSTFRRRRLAEKKYEFSDADENSENIPQNYRIFRRQSQRLIFSSSRSPRLRSLAVPVSELSIDLDDSQGCYRTVYEKLWSPSSAGGASPNDVLKPINQNISSPVHSPREDRRDKGELYRWNSRESLGLFSPVSFNKSSVSSSLKNSDSLITQRNQQSSTEAQVLNCVVDIKRRYIEVDDELVSIITDIEDDELSSATGYHNALPLEVHGSGYSQLQMISNSKADRLMVPGVVVRQLSLDVEQFCHETAQRLCNEAGKKYYFCNDYNVEIIDVCPASRSVIALAAVLVQAANLKTVSALSKTFRGRVGPYATPARKLYCGSFTFVFNIDLKTYYIIDKEPLVENDPYGRMDIDLESISSLDSCEDQLWWQNARAQVRSLRLLSTLPTDYYSSIKVLTNEAVLKGKSLSHIMESHHLVAIIMAPQIGPS